MNIAAANKYCKTFQNFRLSVYFILYTLYLKLIITGIIPHTIKYSSIKIKTASYNRVLKIFRKIRKSNKVRQEQTALKCAFDKFLCTSTKT